MCSFYLNGKKTDAINLYKRQLPRLIITYLFWGIIVVVFNILYLKQEFGIKSIVSLFNFTVQDRAWYMNMYLVSYIFDTVVNRKFNVLYANPKISYWISLAVCFSLSFLLSFFAAYIKDILFKKIKLSKNLLNKKNL